MTEAAYDVLIIGAGIVGAACADEAASAGLRVGVVEGSLVGGGATAAGMGQIVVMDDSEAQFALTRYSQVLWQQMKQQLPAEVEYVTPGTIWVASEADEMPEVERKKQFYADRDVPAEVLDSRALSAQEPNLRSGLAGGLLVPEDMVIYPPCAARFLLDRACSRGATAHIGSAVTAIDGDQVKLANGSILRARIIVNAAGALAPLLTPGVEIHKRKGHLVITDRYPGFIRHQVAELGYLKSAHSLTSDSVAFNVQPRPTGQVLIGSSRQYGVDSSQAEPAMLRQMIARACEFMPGLGSLSAIRAWTGFRAATPDKLPLIGPYPGSEHLWLATGHEGLGITTSLATAKLLVDQLLNRPSAIPIDPYLPSRVQPDVKQEMAHA